MDFNQSSQSIECLFAVSSINLRSSQSSQTIPALKDFSLNGGSKKIRFLIFFVTPIFFPKMGSWTIKFGTLIYCNVPVSCWNQAKNMQKGTPPPPTRGGSFLAFFLYRSFLRESQANRKIAMNLCSNLFGITLFKGKILSFQGCTIA